MSGARATGSATISFGLVSIPTKIYIAASPVKFSFNMITKNGSRVKQKLVDEKTGEEVERKSCLSGYETEKDKYVVFTEEELDALAMEKSNTIELLAITDKVNLSPERVEKAYYLTPDKSDKSYKLFTRCLYDEKKCAVAKWYARGKDNLIAIVSTGDILMMFQLYYEPEIRHAGVAFSKGTDPTDQEVALGKMLMGTLVKDDFKLSDYRDEYLVKVECAIAAKHAGKKIETVKTASTNAAFDLAALLQQSLKKPA